MKLKAITFLLFIALIFIVVKFYETRINKNKMTKSPIEFFYINEETLDLLLKEYPLNPKRINSIILLKGLSFKLSPDFYDEFILKNQKVNLRFVHMILNENADIESSISEKSICNIDRDIPTFLLSQIDQTRFEKSSKNEVIEFKEFINKMNSHKIFALLSYSKKEGWFDYEDALRGNQKIKSETEELRKKLEK